MDASFSEARVARVARVRLFSRSLGRPDISITPGGGNVVVAIVDGELTIMRLRLEHGRVRLAAENPDYPDVVVPELAELSIWGVVTRCLHNV